MTIERPKEHPRLKLQKGSVVWCQPPQPRQGGEPLSARIPMLVNEIKYNDKGEIAAIRAIRTCQGTPKTCDDNIFAFLITDKRQKLVMGVPEADRAVLLNQAQWIPFERRYFGHTVDISGQVPNRLWQHFAQTVRNANLLKQEAAIGALYKGSSIMGWSNLPAEGYTDPRP